MTDTITQKGSIVTASEACQGESGIEEGRHSNQRLGGVRNDAPSEV